MFAEPAGPVITSRRIELSGLSDVENQNIPTWLKSASKLLHRNVSNQDWQTLARKLGYTSSKIASFTETFDPAFSLISDWILTSGNSALSVDLLVSALEQINRQDVVEVILSEQGM